MPAREGTYGLLAEFDTPGDLVRAARQARQDGWRRMDCYTPYPVEEAAEAIGFHRNKVPLVTLIGGLMGWRGHVLAGDLDLGAGLSAEYRGPSARIPGRPSLFRRTSGPFCGPGFRRLSACWRCAGFPRSIIRSSMRPTSATARRRTSSSCASRRSIRSSTWLRPRHISGKLRAGLGGGGGVLMRTQLSAIRDQASATGVARRLAHRCVRCCRRWPRCCSSPAAARTCRTSPR